jgi:LysM repeat protein
MFCKFAWVAYNSAMKPVAHAFSILTILILLNSCQFTGKQASNVGPFDSRGNYVEAWADDPSKWRPYTPKDVDGDPPKIAKNEQPLDQSVPLVAGNATLPPPPTTRSQHKSGSTRTVAGRTSSSRSGHTAAVKKSTSSSKTKASASTKSKSKSKSKTKTASSTRHTVRPGDSLYSIAAKHGTTVSALKQANGISGTMIRDGKSLVIPRRK